MSTSRKIPPKLKKQVWETYTKIPGATENPCYVCHDKITVWDFECGHVKAFADGGPTNIKNLRPICSSCNKSMGKKDLYTYKKEFYETHPKKEKIEALETASHPRRIRKQRAPPSDKSKFITFLETIGTILHITSSKRCEYIFKKGSKKGQQCNKVNCTLHL